MALADDEQAAIAKMIADAMKGGATPMTPIPSHPVSNTTTDITTYLGLGALALVQVVLQTFQLNKTPPAPPVPPPAVVAPVQQDPMQVKLISDVADLQARVKALEPTKK
jgi:hypothetical protein